MTKEEIIEKFTSICKEVFENDEFVYSEELTVGNVDGWTSLTNMMLVAEVEKEFDFKFKLRELDSLDSMAGFIAGIEAHIS